MDIFQHRKASFKKYTQIQLSVKDTENFANAGFYSVRDYTECFLCSFKKSDWKPEQSPFDVHAAEKPNCPWVVLEFPGCLQHSTIEFNVPELKRVQKACEETFKTHPCWPDRLLSPAKLSRACFYYCPTMTHRLRIQCPYCFGNIDEVVEGMDVMKVHKDFNTNCPFLKHKQKSKNNKRKQNKAKEEDIWSIEHALKPPLELLSPLKQPSVTYSKRRKTRSLLQLPAESEVAFSNIVSTRNPSYSTKKHVIIVHPEPTAPSSSLSNFIKDQDIVGLSSSFDEDVQIIDNGCRVIEEFDDKEDMSNWDDDEASCAKKSVTEDMDVEEVKEIIEKKTRLFDAKSRTSKQVDVKHKPKGLIERLETKQDITRIFKKKGGEKDAKSKSRESSAVKTSKALSFFTSGSEVPLITKGKSRSFEETTSSTVKRPLSLSRRKKEQDSTAVKSVYFGKIPDQKAEVDHFKDAEFITVMFKETGLNSCVQIQTIYDKKGDSTVITHHYTD